MNVSAHLRQQLEDGARPGSDLDAARRQGLEEALALLGDARTPPEGEGEDFERGWHEALETVAAWLRSASAGA